MSQSCAFCSGPVSSRTRGANNRLISAMHFIERYALNNTGTIGSLYDAWTDNILSSLPINQDLITKKDVKEPATCHLRKVDDSNYDSLLKMIDIEGELRVSIALGMVQVTEWILMLNNYILPDDRTIRLIDYYHINHEEYLSYEIQNIRNTLPSLLPNNSATHIITSIKRGINFVIALELPKDENHREIDSVLEKLCNYFIKPKAQFISPEEQQKINHLKPTIFTPVADIHSFTKNKNISDICQNIHRYLYECRNNVPLSHTLHRVKCIYIDSSFNEKIFCQQDSWLTQKIEQKILPLSNKLKSIEHLFYDKISRYLSQYLKIRVEEIHAMVSRVNNLYKEVQQLLASKVVELRQGKLSSSLLDKVLSDAQFNSLQSELDSIFAMLLKLQTKADLVVKLREDQHMEYVNVADFEDTEDDEADLQGKLFSLSQGQQKYYLCSSDELMENNSNEYEKLCQELIAECQTKSSLCPVFADFSYCSFKLQAIKIFRPPVSRVMKPIAISPNEINILLIGETGVGKSTFINAFVNYLTFHSLEQARRREPIVLIPVSFLITISDQFEELKIDFGKSDSNEEHNHPGQSVTQHCKSYIFNIGDNMKLRIIDTPGVGDTRGFEQDDKNIADILSYINNLPHLNAVCFLLKPNNTRLHALFRSCFTQLFNFLGPNVRENVIFCFTNTRATFYTPGNTAPLLRQMLTELPKDQTPPFAKVNTFCFDSESFRYLAVIKTTDKVPFDENQENDYKKSWEVSVNESIRFLAFIETCPKYQIDGIHSIKHAEMIILSLVRPILETIRNALRNLVLRASKDGQSTLEMEVQPILQPASLCKSCPCEISTIDSVGIVTHAVHKYRTLNECAKRSCTSNEHIPVFYELKYRSTNPKGVLFHSDTEKMKERLLHGMIMFTEFLLHIAHTSQNPFITWLDLFIEEEEYIYLREPSNIFNVKLYNNIYILKKKYEKSLNENKRDEEYMKLDVIYGCIEEMLAYPMVSAQMKAMRTSQMEMMQDNELDVSSQHPHMDMSGLLKRPRMTN